MYNSIVWLHLGDDFNSENRLLSIGEHNACGFAAVKQIFNNKPYFIHFIISINLLLHSSAFLLLYMCMKGSAQTEE